MKLKETMAALEKLGSPAVKALWLKHGAKEPFFGVKIGDLKPLAKKLKGEQALALELYATGNGDAQYLAGLIADGAKMTRAQVQSWADQAAWRMNSTTMVPVMASEHPDGYALARAWIEAKKEHVAIAGWHSLGALVTIKPDADLPLKEFGALLDRVAKTLPAHCSESVWPSTITIQERARPMRVCTMSSRPKPRASTVSRSRSPASTAAPRPGSWSAPIRC